METRRVFVLLWLLSAVPGVVPIENVYFGLGRELVLDPRVEGDIAVIAWKLNNNLVVDWEKGETFTYFGPFKNRVDLDAKTGVLKLSNATAKDQGEFTVEINNRVHDLRYSAKMIEAAPAPEVGIGPLSCDKHSPSCTAKCDVKGGGPTEPSEPITYSWKMGGAWVKGEKERVIIPDDVKDIKEFFCRMENPIDHKDSEAKENPFYEEPKPIRQPPWIIPLVVIIIILLILAGVVFGLWKTKPQLLTNLLNRSQAAPAKDPSSAEPNAPDQPNTAALLNRTGNDQGTVSEAL